jgi:hypothetical protein
MKLRRLHYNGSNEDKIEEEFIEIKTTIERENEIIAPGWKPMFVVPQWRIRLIHGVLVQVFTQMTGYVPRCIPFLANIYRINVINYYQTIMYKNLGITGEKNLLITGVYNCVGPLTSECSLIWNEL